MVVPRKLVPQSCRTQWSQFNWSWHMNAWEEEGKPFIFGMEKERKLCSIGMQMILIDKKPSHFHFRPPRPRTIFIPKGKNTHKKWYSSCVTKYYLVRCEVIPATALDERKVQKYFGSSILLQHSNAFESISTSILSATHFSWRNEFQRIEGTAATIGMAW